MKKESAVQYRQTIGGMYALLPGSEKYVPLNDAIYRGIMAGKYKF